MRAHADEARASSDAAGQVAFRAVMESAGQLKPEDDRPPAPPADVHANVEQPQSYTKMMAALLDQVNKALDERPELDKSNSALGAARYDAMVEEIEGHQRKVADLQAQLVAKLGELEHDEARKITSEGIHTGFDSSFVNKAQPEEKKTSSSGSSSSTAKNSAGKPELLNPNYDQAAAAEVASSSASQSKTSPDDDYDVDPSDLSDLGRKFASFAPSNHFDSRGLLMAHPEIMTERNEEAILVMAFEAALEGHDDAARQYVHQAKLLEYCRSLGRDGVTMFFKRIETRNHKAQELFYSDVQETYGKIHARVREIRAQQTASTSGVEGGVEQIQLHAVEPGTVINIHIPPPVPELKRLAMETMDSYETAATYRSKTIAGAIASGKSEAEATAEAPTVPDFDPQEFDEAKRCREIFESFSPEMRKALESGSLDKVNEVLGRMPVDEAETLVGQFGDVSFSSSSFSSFPTLILPLRTC